MKVGFQIFRRELLSYLLVSFDQTSVKIIGLESSILKDLLSVYIAFPFKKNINTFWIKKASYLQLCLLFLSGS